jgi:hypothetical protein
MALGRDDAGAMPARQDLDSDAAAGEKRLMPPTDRPATTLGAILRVFTAMGLASFGGGLPGWMHREVVEKRGWLSEESFLAGLALAQVLPGPNSANLALYIGQQLRGWPGATAAALGGGHLGEHMAKHRAWASAGVCRSWFVPLRGMEMHLGSAETDQQTRLRRHAHLWRSAGRGR